MLHKTRIRNPAVLIGALAIAVGAAACAPSTTLEQGWMTPHAYNQPPLTRVVTVFVSESAAVRRGAEDKMAQELSARGVMATPAYSVITDQEASALANLTHPQAATLSPVADKLRSMGFDGIVTLRIIERQQNLEYAPGAGYWGTWGYWGGYWGYPGYAYTEMVYRTETNAYSLRTNQLVWAGLIKSVDPESAHKLIDDTTKIVASQLTKRGLAG
jgi:hypothetical protein